MATNSRSVGVDFGTTTSLVSEGVAGRKPVVFPLGRTTTYLPSLFGLDDADRLVVGDPADDLPISRVKRSVKRCITRNEHEVLLDDGSVLTADEGIRGILKAIAREARTGGLDLSAESTRLGCPAMWDGQQRQRLLGLADEAGLPVSDHTLIDEPVAAGVAWVQQQRGLGREVEGKLLVVDMGGGTLDVALLDVVAGVGHDPEISVLSSWGVDEAGDALDDAITLDLETDLASLGVDPADVSPGVVRRAAREAKIQLSGDLDTVIAVRDPRLSLPSLRYSREQLETAFAPQLHRAERLIWAVLRGADVTHEAQRSPSAIRALTPADLASEVDFVLLAGGMARVPALAGLIQRILPGVDLYTDAGVPTDEAIAAGLGETVAYDRVNLHRPAFSFVLEYTTAGQSRSLPVYDAYDPFYDPWFAMQRHVLYHDWCMQPGESPRSGHGYLRIYTAGGRPVDLKFHDEAHQGAVKVEFGHRPPSIRIYPNGVVRVNDGRRRAQAFRIPTWPVIRGSDHAMLALERVAAERRPEISRPWDNDPLFLH